MTGKRKTAGKASSAEETQMRKKAKLAASKDLYRLMNDAFEKNGPPPTLEQVNDLLQQGANPNYNGSKCVWIAVSLDRDDILQVLLDAGGYCLRGGAFTKACLKGSITTIKLMIKEGADVSQIRPLHSIYDVEQYPSQSAVRLLLEHGVDVNAKNYLGQTPLNLLVKNVGETQFIEHFNILLDAGVDVCKCDANRLAPLHYACRANVSALIVHALLEAGADPNQRDKKGATPMHKLLHGYSPRTAIRIRAVVQKLIDAGWRPQGDKALPIRFLRQVNSGDISFNILSLLLRTGCRLENIDRYGNSFLQVASKKTPCDNRVIGLLLRHNANANYMRNDGKSVLFFAAIGGNAKNVIQALLKKNAQINAVDDDGWTALHHACCVGNVKAIQALLDVGANILAVDENRMTPFEVACINKHVPAIYHLLRQHVSIHQLCL